MTVSAKQAAVNASEFLNQSISEAILIRLEEIDRNASQTKWLITLSFQRPEQAFVGDREYKTFEVDAQSGEVMSMKVRHVGP